MRNRRLIVLVLACALFAVACSSGPSRPDLPLPTTTTTTEPPPPGETVVAIRNGAFRPSNLKVDLAEIQVVRWVHEDRERFEYILSQADGLWEPVTLNRGDEFSFDFSTLEPGLYRYTAQLGNSFLPGIIDSRPEQ